MNALPLTTLQVVNLVLNALSLLVFAFVIPMLNTLRGLRANEMHGIQESLERIERKIDSHLQWHSKSGGADKSV